MSHDVRVPLCMPVSSSNKIISHRFHVDKNEDESGIWYYTIIGSDIIVNIGHFADVKHPVFQCGGATVTMKEPSDMLGKTDLTSRKMREVVMKTVEPVYN